MKRKARDDCAASALSSKKRKIDVRSSSQRLQWNDIPSWRTDAGCPLVSCPEDVLDMIFAHDTGLAMRDYVALAGTCRYFCQRFTDVYWQALLTVHYSHYLWKAYQPSTIDRPLIFQFMPSYRRTMYFAPFWGNPLHFSLHHLFYGLNSVFPSHLLPDAPLREQRSPWPSDADVKAIASRSKIIVSTFFTRREPPAEDRTSAGSSSSSPLSCSPKNRSSSSLSRPQRKRPLWMMDQHYDSDDEDLYPNPSKIRRIRDPKQWQNLAYIPPSSSKGTLHSTWRAAAVELVLSPRLSQSAAMEKYNLSRTLVKLVGTGVEMKDGIKLQSVTYYEAGVEAIAFKAHGGPIRYKAFREWKANLRAGMTPRTTRSMSKRRQDDTAED